MPKLSFEQRAERRNRLIALLRSEEHWITSKLREQLGISQRTLMRELAELRDLGYPLESDRGRGGGVRLRGNWGIERLHLNHQEVVELILALAIMENLKSPFLTGHLKGIRQKLFQAFPQEQRKTVANIRKRILIGDKANDNVLANFDSLATALSKDIAEAFLKQKCLEINYESEAKELTTRVIETQYILLNWPVWYVIAWDHLRESSRIFRIDRIKSTQMTDNGFRLRPRPQFNDVFKPYFQAL
jgi:predicted DNA-binding transcriptional regulator YafY